MACPNLSLLVDPSMSCPTCIQGEKVGEKDLVGRPVGTLLALGLGQRVGTPLLGVCETVGCSLGEKVG